MKPPAAGSVWWNARSSREAVPLVAGMAATLLLTAPIFADSVVMPHVPLLLVIIWALYQPALMPPWAALAIGAASDLALGLPLGVNATALPAVALVIARGGRLFSATRPFVADWALALALVALGLAIGWQLLALTATPRDPAALLPQWLITCALFPTVARASAWAHRRIVTA